MERWKNKVAVVTGVSKGIGKVIAKALVDNGLKVVGIARNTEPIKEIDGKFYVVKADLKEEEDIVNAFKWIYDTLGPVHVLINNAATYDFSLLIDGNSSAWKDAFDVNVIGLCIATRESIQQMRKHEIDGHIIHIDSIFGHKVVINPPMNAYSASKYAVTALTETLRQELNSMQSKIKISSISPGLTKTETIANSNISYPTLHCEDVSDAVCYVLGTPPHVQVHELMIRPIGDPQ